MPSMPGRETGNLIPCLTVRDAERSISFYESAFGFQITDEILRDGKGKPVHAAMSFEGKPAVMFAPENPDDPAMKSPATTKNPMPVVFYVYCSGIDAFTENARKNGATVVAEPEDMFWGDRIAQFRDPDGYLWTFAENFGAVDMSKAPEGLVQG